MLLFPFLRAIFGVLSLVLLGAALYLLATWAMADPRIVDGVVVDQRDDWRLWVGLGLLAWSFLGKLPVQMLLAKPGGPHFSRAKEHASVAGAAGAKLHVETAGPVDGPPVVLTHGWGMDASIWTPTREALSDRFRLILWDLPGLGLSKIPSTETVTLPNFAESLARVLDTASRPVVLIGHSIGGMTIQTLVRDRPDLFGTKVAGIVLLNTTHTNPLKTIVLSGLMRALQPVLELGSKVVVWLQPLVWLNAWQSYLSGSTHMAMRLGFGPRVTRRELNHASLLTTRNPPGVQAQGNIAMFHWDATGALANLPVPVLVIAGERDILTKPEASHTIANSAPRSDLRPIPRGNHMSVLDERDAYHAAIRTFVESVQTR